MLWLITTSGSSGGARLPGGAQRLEQASRDVLRHASAVPRSSMYAITSPTNSDAISLMGDRNSATARLTTKPGTPAPRPSVSLNRSPRLVSQPGPIPASSPATRASTSSEITRHSASGSAACASRAGVPGSRATSSRAISISAVAFPSARATATNRSLNWSAVRSRSLSTGGAAPAVRGPAATNPVSTAAAPSVSGSPSNTPTRDAASSARAAGSRSLSPPMPRSGVRGREAPSQAKVEATSPQ